MTGPLDVQVAWQVAVRPGSFKVAADKIWVVENPEDVRPYGLLLREHRKQD